MKKYRVTQVETWVRTVEVDADSEDEATAILKAGDWIFEMDNLELSQVDSTTCEEMTLVGEAARAQEVYSLDELERFAAERNGG